MSMPKALSVFANTPVTGNTPHELWKAIQHGAIVCTSIDKQIASLRPADSTETCYVFWDECEQMSMPYESEAVAREAFRVYVINLTSDALNDAAEMNDNMRKYGTIDKPKSLSALAECSPACNCMKCNPSKSSCIALRASELNLPHVDVSGSELPRVERFGDLPDGTLFYLAQTYAYGGRKKLIKTLEDGGPHNAVYNEYGGIGIQLRNEQLVFRA